MSFTFMLNVEFVSLVWILNHPSNAVVASTLQYIKMLWWSLKNENVSFLSNFLLFRISFQPTFFT